MKKSNYPFQFVRVAISASLLASLASFSVTAAEQCDPNSSVCYSSGASVQGLAVNNQTSFEPLVELTLASTDTGCTNDLVTFSPDAVIGITAFSILQKAKLGSLPVNVAYDKTEPSSGVWVCELKYISF